ncbi:MAG: peptidylprolyl isomerase [Anaerolineae bacterium]|nr:peptidylprolyl isomerase [Anaerolineae bacterium]
MGRNLLVVSIVALLMGLGGCRAPDSRILTRAAPTSARSGPSSDLAAVVNGQGIPLDRYQAQLQIALASYAEGSGLDPESAEGQAALAALKVQVLEWMIDQVLIDQAAARAGITVDEAQVEAEVERIRSHNPSGFADWLRENGLTEASFRSQVRSDLLGAAMRERVTADIASTAEQVHLRQIVVESEGKARTLLEQLRAGSVPFEDAARAHSIDESSRDGGGDLGFLPRGVLPQSVESAAFGLEPGEIAGPIRSDLGWHLIQLVERDAAREVPPELLAALRQEAFMKWLEGERERAQVLRYVSIGGALSN